MPQLKTNAVCALRLEVKTAIMWEAVSLHALVVKGLSRLPVTEEIAGSNPVERAKTLLYYKKLPSLQLGAVLLII
jgi:hypothetical protein